LDDIEIILKLRYDLLSLLDYEVPFERDLKKIMDIGLWMNYEEWNDDNKIVDHILTIG